MDLEGKTILITGSARRIGKALSLGIAKAGGNLLLHYNKSPDEAIKLKNEIRKIGQKADIVQADFSDPSASISSFEQYFSSGNIFGLINNASVFSDISWNDIENLFIALDAEVTEGQLSKDTCQEGGRFLECTLNSLNIVQSLLYIEIYSTFP